MAGSLFIGAACPSGPASAPIDVSKYDRSCATADDCVEATSDACHCPGTAINKSDQEQHWKDVEAARESCGPAERAPCREQEVGCDNEICEIVESDG